MGVLYCDGSTYLNGQPGQDSSFIVRKADGTFIREHLGDFSINYAELSAIIRAFEVCDLGDTIYSDSNVCVNWVNYPYKRTKLNKYLEDKILYAQDLLHEKGLELKYVSREANLAGLELEENPFYGKGHDARLEDFRERRAYGYFLKKYNLSKEEIDERLK